MKNIQKEKLFQRKRRLNRTRQKVRGNGLPRLSVFRSLKHFSDQIIDDAKGVTLCAAHDRELKAKGKKPIEIAALVGTLIAEKALAKKVANVVFDRGSYQYHGCVKAAADAARTAGLKF